MAAGRQVGINQTRKELGVSDRALHTACQRHGLGLPSRPTATPATPALAGVCGLNRGLLPAWGRSNQELAARCAATRSTPPWAPRSWSS
jgi:hypothetical protein